MHTEEKLAAAWGRVKEAVKRDWHSREKTGANTFEDAYKDLEWEDVEGPIAFGHGAHEQYTDHAWDDALEARLEDEWEEHDSPTDKTRRRWDEVKSWVRFGFERGRDRARTH